MASNDAQNSDDGFTPLGIIEVSASALKLARDFSSAVNSKQHGNWVACFDWSESTSVQLGPNEPSEDIGACLALGAFERHEIPQALIQTIDGVELVIKIPRDVWEKSALRLIDIDETLLFKLALR